MTKYQVTYHIDIEARTAEAAALEADRLLQTNRPKDFNVTAGSRGTAFIRVERGEAKRIA